ncbi:Uncharacterised protein [uncultured Clostridium sp.]|uniref:hypothetical protein n=1 Tax=uncultured Clostridium sp. TaxID=59620 RepID=UPI0008227470|nr:hypothetical protein [uncultured Clostridium sp.]SCK04453.1 Uncharacterised protein [uncultured Clostridium sp.]
MDGNNEILNFIYQNSEMGTETIKHLIDITENSTNNEFKDVLYSQYNEYKKIFNESEKMIKDRGNDPKDINKFQKITTYIMINMKTLTDKSPSHLSEMLIQGSTMGIIDATKRINQYDDADKDVLDLANRLLEFEKDNQEEWKKFL